ncbi:peptidase M50 [Thermosinus carboxydivorans Nor1]|uniref:Peptidase M50 n=1 Tax=Thermosinus carboxydivorans Nor1 TaxID=401526 RepID=A1HT02_9FIRM|nr:site-2 protease family protein [Thermosinus carboxydivorans]EAX46857.1 peptidase M50 [Thermosinus carboxydivorans Nor1]
MCAAGLVAMTSLGPAAAMAVSILMSLAVYAYVFGLKFAVGFIILLLVHELGHIIASRVVGLRTGGPMFVPFVGAVISLHKPPQSAKMEANIAIGGPALGTLSALVCLILYLWTDSTLMLALAYTASLLNLFNLIPCAPLDGGRIAAAISPHLWWAGSATLGALAIVTSNFFIFVVFLFSLARLWLGAEDDTGPEYYAMTVRQRLTVAWWYFGLLTVLGLMTWQLVAALR